MRHATSFLLMVCSLAAIGCSESHVGDHDAGPNAEDDASIGSDGSIGDDGSIALDGGATDGGWVDVDAGWCECPAPPPGCMYVGSPCPCSELYCQDDGGAARPCGGFAGFACSDTEFCDFTEPHSCGAADESGWCTPRPLGCTFEVDPHCGCDGITYGNECAAHQAGVDALRAGPCDGAGCIPEDAHGEGLCDAIVGYAWNGTGCVFLSGCSCVGADCGRWASIEACEAAHVECPRPP